MVLDRCVEVVTPSGTGLCSACQECLAVISAEPGPGDAARTRSVGAEAGRLESSDCAVEVDVCDSRVEGLEPAVNVNDEV